MTGQSDNARLTEKMSRNSVNYVSSGGSVGAEVKFAGNDSKSKMYEPKHKKKLVRVLTVIAYIFSVSLAAITLSLFYLFIYNPGKPGHNAGQTNNTGKLYSRNNEGIIIINNTYPNYDREEPRALPLETIHQEANSSMAMNTSVKRGKRVVIEPEISINPEEKSVYRRTIRTLSLT